MPRTIEQVKKEIENLRDYMMCQEIGNDFYYTRGSYDDDSRTLSALKQELKELEESANE